MSKMRTGDNNYCNTKSMQTHWRCTEVTTWILKVRKTNEIFPCNTFSLEKLIPLRKVAKFPSFYGAWLWCVHRPVFCPYPDSHKSSPHPPIIFWSSLILSCYLNILFGLFPSGSPTKILCTWIFAFTPAAFLIRRIRLD